MSSDVIDACSYSEKLNEFYSDIKCFENTIESDYGIINRIDSYINKNRLKIILNGINAGYESMKYCQWSETFVSGFVIDYLNETYKKITNALIPLKDKQDHYNNIYKLIYGSVRTEYEKIMYTDLYNELKIAYTKYNNIKKDYEDTIRVYIIAILRFYNSFNQSKNDQHNICILE